MNKAFKSTINNIKQVIRMKISPSHNLNIIIQELENVISSDKIKPINKSNILKAMHLLRALETTLKEYLDEKSISYSPRDGMGQIFHKYLDNSIISNLELTRYKNNLSTVRNTFMHNAGVYPSNNDVTILLEISQTFFHPFHF